MCGLHSAISCVTNSCHFILHRIGRSVSVSPKMSCSAWANVHSFPRQLHLPAKESSAASQPQAWGEEGPAPRGCLLTARGSPGQSPKASGSENPCSAPQGSNSDSRPHQHGEVWQHFLVHHTALATATVLTNPDLEYNFQILPGLWQPFPGAAILVF